MLSILMTMMMGEQAHTMTMDQALRRSCQPHLGSQKILETGLQNHAESRCDGSLVAARHPPSAAALFLLLRLSAILHVVLRSRACFFASDEHKRGFRLHRSYPDLSAMSLSLPALIFIIGCFLQL